MLAGQLCVFDDKTVFEKTCSVVVLSGSSSLFYEEFDVYCNLMSMHAK